MNPESVKANVLAIAKRLSAASGAAAGGAAAADSGRGGAAAADAGSGAADAGESALGSADAVAARRSSEAVAARFSAEMDAAKEKVKKEFNEIIKQFELDGRFHLEKLKDYDYLIGLPEHAKDIGSHHVHFYIKHDLYLAWHHRNHGKRTRDPPEKNSYKPFTTLDAIFTSLTENAIGIKTFEQRFAEAEVHDPFASSIKSKKGQRQKRSYRKKSYRKRSYRKRS
jgi:hypothetical protein